MTLHVSERVEVAHEMRILVHSLATAQRIHPLATQAGDIKLDWLATDSESVKLAREAFDRALKAGFKAFRMDAKGKQGDPITSFDVNAEKLLLIPQVVGG